MPIKTGFVTLVKVISTLLITGAIFIEGWHIVSGHTLIEDHLISASFMPVIWIGQFALIAHAVEGVIAGAIAPSKEKPAVRYAVYTFFVGTVGLVELIDEDQRPGFLSGWKR
jgi:hypothetical protein